MDGREMEIGIVDKCYDVAVLGATFLGLGAALKLKNVIVIEKNGFFGAEFINSYKVCQSKSVDLKTELGSRFAENMRKRGLIAENGDVYQAPAMYVISEYLKDTSAEILLMTEVIEIKRENGFYFITVYHANGFETIVAKTLLDTTLLGIGCKETDKPRITKTLNSIIINPQRKMIDHLFYNTASDLYTYMMPVSVEKSRFDAVEELFERTKEFPDHELKISSIAPDFSYHLEPFHCMVGDGHIWDPSVAYTNLVEAFDVGVQIAERIKK